jgi:hypothetical protein
MDGPSQRRAYALRENERLHAMDIHEILNAYERNTWGEEDPHVAVDPPASYESIMHVWDGEVA